MSRYLFPLALLLSLDHTDGAESVVRPGAPLTTCNAVWRCRANVYKQGSTYAGRWPQIPDLEGCMTKCSRDYPTCTAFEYRMGNCWIQTVPITADSLIHWKGTIQFYLAQRCDSESCIANWLEVGANYPKGFTLPDYDLELRDKCFNRCATSSSDSSTPCARVFYSPTDGEGNEGSCTLKQADDDTSPPQGVIEYRLIDCCQ